MFLIIFIYFNLFLSLLGWKNINQLRLFVHVCLDLDVKLGLQILKKDLFLQTFCVSYNINYYN